MQILILLIAMVLVGLLMGAIGSLIWKENKPLGAAGDYIVAIISAIVIGLMDWYVIPEMGFSNTIKYLGVVTEPALGALFVLWLARKVKK
ncbi:MAG: hypothetical protein DRJ03_18705 [Chloroflexi bacterium]|nr:MAG: hypothetical protein DRJ03_18705 [Chloroflexota bacterium]RLC98973.1 MAG: hypothetical protein DRI77_03840 [Chloroflexota bacterium]